MGRPCNHCGLPDGAEYTHVCSSGMVVSGTLGFPVLDQSICRRCDQSRHRHQYVVGVGEVCPVGVFTFAPVQPVGGGS